MLLWQLKLATAFDVDHVWYALHFEHIEAVLSLDGTVGVYLRSRCDQLENHRCRAHDTPHQPSICVTYNPFTCFYRPAFEDTSVVSVRLDLARMALLRAQTIVDQRGAITETPSPASLIALFRATGSISTPLLEREAVPARKTSLRVVDLPAENACSRCESYCCHYLLFPIGLPQTWSAVDHLRYLLGFPGIEIGVNPSGWSLIVASRCRALKDGLCSIFGSTNRPHVCTGYDATSCSYRRQFGPERSDLLRLDAAGFTTLLPEFKFDDTGQLVELPPALRS